MARSLGDSSSTSLLQGVVFYPRVRFRLYSQLVFQMKGAFTVFVNDFVDG